MLFQEVVHSSGYKIPYKSKNIWVEVRLKRIKKINVDTLFTVAIYNLERRDRRIQEVITKLINNSLSLKKGNHDRDVVWICDLNSHLFLSFLLSFSFD